MRVNLLHNPGAGTGEHERSDLLAMLEAAGHDVSYQSTKAKGYAAALERPSDVVLVAGGDGTVGKVVRKLVGKCNVPVAVLALGTANNFARSLGFDADPQRVIDGLATGRRRRLDIGVARGPFGERMFLEGCGGGLFPDYMQALKTADDDQLDDLKQRMGLERDLLLLSRLLRDYQAQEWSIEVDGRSRSGRWLVLAALNIEAIGPRLTLAPGTDPGDGRLALVTVAESDREAFMDWLDAQLEGQDRPFPLPSEPCERLAIRWTGPSLNFDDKLWPTSKHRKKNSAPAHGLVEIGLCRAALTVLAPST